LVEIPQRGDPTLDAVNAAIEAEQSPYASKNIGFGEIGHECSRYLWYKINLNEPEVFNADTLRIFRNGHEDEAAMAADLRKVKGIELYTHDPERDNKQYKLDALGGRFTGRLDGVIVGLKQAPKTIHIWEHKSTNEKKFAALLKNPVLHDWNFTYYCQAQSNMYHADLDRHYMTVSTPGLRQVTSIRTELDKKFAESLVQKAKRIIEAKEPPERIGGPDWHTCKYCRFYDTCHNLKGDIK
jgi:CRISPR/Cas system-associated exonuclease Cas4 (RecB family)